MKWIIYLIICVGVFLPYLLWGQQGQPEQDCINAIPVCQSTYSQPNSYVGIGNGSSEINSDPSCLNSGEKNGVWYIFTIEQSGNLGFLITPNNLFDDYDWAVYNLTNATCADIYGNASLEVSCNFSGTSGPTGPNGATNQSSQGAGGTPFNAAIPVIQGETYVLYISNYSSSQSGYNLNFGLSTATIFDQTPPQLNGITSTIICNTSTFKIAFSENILCNTVQPADFQLVSPTGIIHTITNTNGAACTSDPESYDDQFTLTIDPPITESGIYIFKLVGTVTDICGNIAPPADYPIEIEPLIANAGPDTYVCEGGDGILLNGSGFGGTNLTYEWSPATGLSNPNIANPNANPTVTTEYYLKVKNQLCESKYDTIIVEVKPKPAMDIEGILEVCPNGGSTTITGTGAETYYWEHLSAFQNPVTLTPTTSYTFTVIPYVGDCPGDPFIVELTTDPPAQITASGNLICQNAPVTLQANTGANLSYQWKLNGQVIPNATNDTYQATVAGTYTLVVTKTTTNCTAEDNITLDQAVLFSAGTADPTSICLGQTVNISTQDFTDATYQWRKNGAVIPDANGVSYAATDAGDYDVIISYAGGCLDTTNVVTVNLNPQPNAPTAEDVVICGTQSATLTASSTINGVTFHWFDAPNGTELATGASFATPILSESTEFFVRIVTAEGCISQFTTVSVIFSPVEAPTATAGTPVCVSGAMVITASSNIAGAQFNWFTSATGGSPIFTGNPFQTPSISNTTTYYVSITDANGCISTRTAVAATVVVLPVPTIQTPPGSCEPQTFTLTASSTVNNPIFTWYSTPTGGAKIYTGNPFETPLVSQTTTYYVSVMDQNGCESNRTAVTVTINPVPPGPAVMPGSILCGGGSTTLTASGGGNGATYRWYDENGTLLFTGAAYTTPTITQSTSYFVKVTSAAGCESEATLANVNVSGSPYAPLAFVPTPHCSGKPILVSAVLVTNPVYKWYTTAVGGVPVHIGNSYVPQPGVTAYYVSVTDQDGCESSRTYINVPQTPPAPTVTANPDNFCASGTVTFTATNTGTTGLTYRWFNSSDVSGAPLFIGNPFIVENITSNITLYAVAVNQYLCYSSPVPVSVTVKPIPTATIVPAGPTAFCVGESVTLDAQTDVGTSYQWFLNGGVIPGATNPSYTTTQAGSYTVRITANGCTATSETVIVTVYPKPNGYIAKSANTNTLCIGETMTLKFIGNNITSFQWFKDGQPVPGATTATFIVNETGNYTVEVKNPQGCALTPQEISIKVIDLQINAGEDVSVVCGTSVKLSTAYVQGASYTWSPSTDLTAPFGVETIASPNETRTYTLTVKLGPCTRTDEVTITVVPLTVEVTSMLIDKCKNQYYLSGVSNSSTATFSWSPPAGLDNPYGSSPTATISNNASYTLTVRQANCVAVAPPINLLAYPAVSVGADQSFCLIGDNPNVTPYPLTEGLPAGGVWSGPGVVQQGNGYVFDPRTISQNGTVQLTYTFPPFDGCSTRQQMVIHRANAPDPQAICLNEREFMPTGHSPQNGRWDIPSNPQALLNQYSGKVDLIKLGVGTHKMVYTTTAECKDTFLLTVHDTIRPFDFSMPKEIGTFITVPITNLSDTLGASFVWKFGADSLTQTSITPAYYFQKTGNFPVRLTATTIDGCVSTLTKNIRVTEEEVLEIPDAISLSGPDVNQRFTILGPTVYQDFSLVIYSRWGQKVFESNTLTDTWNGKINNTGTVVLEGVYTYILQMTTAKGNKIRKLGTITVIN